MAENNLVSFKVYFENDGTSEVRRFGIENGFAANYWYLTEKLQDVFPCLKNAKNIQIYWKDSENDNVRICSDAELIIALTEISDPIKKLYVKIAPADNGISDQPQLTQEGVNESADLNLHPNVVCDSCDGSVLGFRYKCLQCRDYDLCFNCESKGFHSEHFMLRMPTPAVLDAWVSDERRGKGFHQKWHHIATAAANRTCPASSSHHSKKHYKKHHGKHHNPMKLVDSITDVVSHVLNNVADFIPQQAVGAPESNDKSSSRPNDVTAGAASATATREASSSARASAAGHSSANGTSTDPNCDNIMDSLVQNLDSVLSNVFSAVNDIQTEGQDNMNDSSNKNRDSGNRPEAIVNVNTMMKDLLSVAISELSKAQKLCEAGNHEKKVSSGGDNQEKKNESSPSDISANKGAASSSSSSASIYPTAPKVDEVLTPEELKNVLFSDNDGIRVKPAGEEHVFQQKEAENGWTILTNEKKESPCTPTNNTGAIPKTNINASTENNDKDSITAGGAAAAAVAVGEGDGVKKEKPYDEDKVQKSLRHMLTMGFSNEGNWLFDLLVQKNGDITAVIEHLVPSVRK